MVWFNGGNAHTEVAINLQNVFYKLLEIGVFILVTSHIDARQHDFLEAMGDDFKHIIIYVFSRTACGASSHHWDDAVGAEVVAAVVDFDEAAGVEGVEGGLVAEQVAVVTLWVAVTRAEMLVNDIEQSGFPFIVDDIVRNA